MHDHPIHVRTVACPTCGGPSLFSVGNAFRPFCCARCKHIDLGAWANEKFKVPQEAPSPVDDSMAQSRLQ